MGPSWTVCRQDLGDAAGCSIPYLLHYLISVKNNKNLEETWVFLRVEKVLDVTQARLRPLCVQWFSPA